MFGSSLMATFDTFAWTHDSLRKAPTMSHVSQARKLRKKVLVRPLKVVQSVTRRGLDILTTEEVRTPRRDSKKASLSRATKQSSSPVKRLKLDGFDAEPLPCNLEGLEESEKRPTLVFILL